jgi:hypothetical protein
MKLDDVVQSARDAIQVGESVARWHVGGARASSVSMHVDPRSQGIISIDVGVVAYRRRLFGGEKLWHGFVAIDNGGKEADFHVGGEYSDEQFAQLSALPGSGFPPEPLDVDSIALDSREALGLAANRVTEKGRAFRSGGALQLLLRKLDGRPTWHIQYEVPDSLGVYVLMVDAGTGEVMYERLPPDWT